MPFDAKPTNPAHASSVLPVELRDLVYAVDGKRLIDGLSLRLDAGAPLAGDVEHREVLGELDGIVERGEQRGDADAHLLRALARRQRTESSAVGGQEHPARRAGSRASALGRLGAPRGSLALVR